MHFTLYALDGIWGPNPLKVAFFLEQLGLDYEVKTLAMNSTDKEKGVKGEDYLKICANGRTPTLIDHKNNDFTVWESGAILQYLARKYDPSSQYTGKSLEEQAIVDQWFFFQCTGHSPVQGNLHFSKMYWQDKYHEEAPENVVSRFRDETNRVLSVYEGQLQRQTEKYGEEKAWLVLDHPTVADFSAMPWLGSLAKFGDKLAIDLTQYPHVFKYVKMYLQLPSVAKVLEKLNMTYV
ncbi:hypothetical protein CBS9595_001967 [Malassezia furfur]|nr:hypothetical protein CBS9595_001967 [Malassezia furfur]